jgi:hypothetical protein
MEELDTKNADLVLAILGLRAFAAAYHSYTTTKAKDIDWSDPLIVMVRDIEFEIVRERNQKSQDEEE